MSQPRMLDLFCGAGGSARGYQLAGFHVTGVDLVPQPRYAGDEFIQADALTFPVAGYDAIHASPPCQAFTAYRRRGDGVGDNAPDLIAQVRLWIDTDDDRPFVLENVVGSPVDPYVQLCGSSFGLDVRRHRIFESNVPMLSPPCAHGSQRPRFPQATNRTNPRRTVEVGVWRIPLELQRRAMGIEWMTRAELSEAVPPAYTEYIGGHLIAALIEVPA